ncbi:Putative FeFe hydrogenase subunit HydC (NuoE) [Elusimicrobium minutum Pei191]|uniref:Putative FeFe hydrogenase subunit HydC (NuoE) n=1 Tax=Elusimicrobium minutum (strain Pei191) TaxID=445932 RepID=B2KCG5_ELUMP|nr:NAD(P)H-dependent oxidoreductase subunit E [Elusimicrobium minutum]ACC98086.1 Putative FeFe hydrogenase subunit HydC (NuoE) [Elusimicrobium minutum Pei191]
MSDTVNTAAPKIDLKKITDKWQGKQGSLIMILHEIQDTLGYVPREISLELSQLINVPLAQIYEVLSFYHFFKLTPPAKYRISVCTGTACYLKGAPEIIKEFTRLLGIKEGEQTKDSNFSLTGVRCVGCCGLAPVVSVNGKIFGAVKATEVKNIVQEYKGQNNG